MDARGDDAGTARAAMRGLLGLTLLAFTGFSVTLAALPLQAAREGAGIGAAGLVTTVMLGATVASQLLVPGAAARWGTPRVLGAGLVLLGAPAPLALAVPAPWWLMVVSGVRGVGFAVVTVLGATLAAQIAPAGRRGRAVGLYGLAIALPNLAAVPVGAALTQDGRFAVVAAVAAVPVPALVLVRVTTRGVAPGPDRAAPSPRILATVAVPSVMLLAVTLAGGGLVTFLPIARPAGPTAVLALAAYGGTGAVARWAAGTASDRRGTRVMLPASLLLTAAGLVGVAGGLLLVAPVLVVAAAAVVGVGYGAVQNLTLVEAFARSPAPGPASAVWNLCFDAGTALGAVVVGTVAVAGPGFAGAYVLCAALIVVSLPLALVGGRSGRSCRVGVGGSP